MLGTSVIIFREVLEAALIITLMLAATRGLLGRGRWVSVGITAGLAGALLLAFLAEQISLFASGTGQELLNASILLAAVGMLTWHLVWMRKHAAEITQQIRRVGAQVLAGEKAPTALAVIVGLAVLREGSEVVLFMHGIAASGSNASQMMLGSLIGVAAGISIGFILYFGLIRIPVQHLFRVTGWLILLLAAGLAAQAAGYLVQANLLPALSNQVWDSSSILSQQSLFGQFMHITLGYMDRPMGIQLLVYTATLLGILLLTRMVNQPERGMPIKAFASVIVMVAAFIFYAQPSHASHKVYSPHVEKGEAELEWRGHRTLDSDSTKDGQEKFIFEFGYGVTDRWFTSVFGEVEKENGDREYEATAWENIFQLTDQGQYWVDVGLYFEYELAAESYNNDKVEAKILLEKNVGQFVNTLNLEFERTLGGGSNATEFGYAWRTKYLYSKHLEPGIEIYGSFGEFGHVSPSDQQDHRIGPVLSGQLAGEGKSKWMYDIGYLFGISDAAPNGTIKAAIEYEFRF